MINLTEITSENEFYTLTARLQFLEANISETTAHGTLSGRRKTEKHTWLHILCKQNAGMDRVKYFPEIYQACRFYTFSKEDVMDELDELRGE